MKPLDFIRLFRSKRTVEIIGELDPHWDRGSLDWVLDAPISFIWVVDGKVRYDFKVPVGFHTDLSSIPRWARSIIPQIGRQNRPSVGHDFAYEDGVPGMERVEADLMFLDGMKRDKVNALRRWVMYGAVAAGGSPLWGKGES